MNQAIIDFIEEKRIAVVGASRSGQKFGNRVATELVQRGYQVFLVHPEAGEIDGQVCYPNLAALAGQVDGVWVCVSPRRSAGVVREAVAAGLARVWLQQGAETPEALEIARAANMSLVSGKCLLMYAQPVQGFHRWHRVFAGLFGQL